MGYERDETGHWLAGLSDPMLALRDFLIAHGEMERRQARRMGINATDMQALRLLELHGPLGPTELSRRLDLRSASVTVLIDRLEAGGLVERVRDDRDRRRVTVRARPQALTMLFDTWAPIVRAMDDVGHALTRAQQRAVRTFFDEMVDVIHATDDPPEAGRRDETRVKA